MASFRNIYTSMMLVIARSTDRELARQVSYLKAENHVLRSRLPGSISITDREKAWLVRFAKKFGSALNVPATIVHPSTIRRWIREAAGHPMHGPTLEHVQRSLAPSFAIDDSLE